MVGNKIPWTVFPSNDRRSRLNATHPRARGYSGNFYEVSIGNLHEILMTDHEDISRSRPPLPAHVRITTVDDNNYQPRTHGISISPSTTATWRRLVIIAGLPGQDNGEKLPITLLMTIISIHRFPCYDARTTSRGLSINLIRVKE